MEKVTKPIVKTLATGQKLIAKQMQADKGDLLPEHLADVESILFIHEGACTLRIDGREKPLKPNDAYIIPANVKHQIKVEEDNFKGTHFMPKEIKFEYF